MNQVVDIVFQLAIIMFSIVIHEVSHGVIAYSLGDPTAKNEGRLTLNPISHIDIFGSILLPFFLLVASYSAGIPPRVFGYAKPVPYNPFYLRNKKWGPALVGAAGPISNIVIALVFAFLYRFVGIYLPQSFTDIVSFVIGTNIMLAIFNILPIPPLDGSRVLFAILPSKFAGTQQVLETYGMTILLILVFVMPGILYLMMSPLLVVFSYIISLIIGIGF